MAMSDEEVKQSERKLIGNFPNTYTFTKNLAEKYMKKHQGHVKCIIWRPSVIASSLEQPFKGWTDTLSAAGGMTVLGTLGILRCTHLPKPNPFDLIPVDIVSNGLLVATAYHGDEAQTEPLTVYNCTTTSQNPIAAEGFNDITMEALRYTQINGQVRPMNCTHTRSKLDYNIRQFFGE